MTKKAMFLGLTLAIGCTGAFAEDQSDYERNTGTSSSTETSRDSDGMRHPDGMQNSDGMRNSDRSRDPDNTGLNKRDRDGANQTPQNQSNSGKDVNTLGEVRRAVVDEDSLSVTAKNVKIMVEDGVVILRGPVESKAEKERIGSLAKGVKGVTKVDNQLDIKKP